MQPRRSRLIDFGDDTFGPAMVPMVEGGPSISGPKSFKYVDLGDGHFAQAIVLLNEDGTPFVSGGVTDHGLLTGLADNDHPQYQLRTEKAQANGYAGLGAGGLVPTAQLGTGTANSTKYLAGDGSWQTTPIVISAHSGLSGLSANDHPQYQLITGKGVASGYAGLDSGALVPVAQLGTGVSVTTKYLRGDQTWQTLPAQDFAYASLTGAPDLTIYPLLDGTRPYTGNLRAPTISVGGAPLTGPLLSIPVAPTASANYGLISLGSGPFDGVTSGFYVGNSNGTHIAINAASGYTGRMADWQVGGVRMFGVGRPTQASGASATLNAIDLPSFTVSVTGSTNITTATGFNYTRLGIPTYSATSALAITNAATLAIEGAPTGAGTGPATITNTYALWVQAGATRLDSTLQFSTDVTLARLAAASLRLGAAASAAPTGYTLQIGESARGGTDTNTAGASATITSGIGTGTGAASSILFQTPTVGSTGSVAQTLATRLTVATAGITATVPVLIPDGSIGTAPGFGFANQPLTGIYRPASQVIGFMTAGINVETVRIGGQTALTLHGGVTLGWAATTSDTAVDLSLRRLTAASLQLGGADKASPVANTISIGESSRAGTDSNVAGASGTIQPGRGTGTGATVPLILKAPIQVASGTGAQTYSEGFRVQAVATAIGLSFFGASAVVQQTRGATLTNNVTSGGTDDTIANYTDLTTYATDAAAIRNNIYQLARALRQHDVALRAYGLLT